MQAEQNKDPTERQMTKIAREAAKFTVQMMKADGIGNDELATIDGKLAQVVKIMGNDITNSFNIYKIITEADSPVSLLSALSDRVNPLPIGSIVAKKDNVDDHEDGTYQNYLHYFKTNKFLEDENEN